MKNSRYATIGAAALKAQEPTGFTVVDCRKKHLGGDSHFEDLLFSTELTFDYKPLTLEEAHVSKRFFRCSIAAGLIALVAFLVIFA